MTHADYNLLRARRRGPGENAVEERYDRGHAFE